MNNINIIVFTMKGCPHCTDFKKMLQEKKIDFYDRDIDDYNDEYQLFLKITENNFIPALLIIETDGDKQESFVYAPESHYNTLEEAVVIIENHLTKSNLI